MKWIIGTLNPGDHIRVKRDYYYHHGVYLGNDEVIHYTGENGDALTDPRKVLVRKTSLDFFTGNGLVEKAKLNLYEKLFKRSNKDIIRRALANLNQSGYDPIHHNCEDFANECCYKKPLTSQVNELKDKI